jgi:hypothetical protein
LSQVCLIALSYFDCDITFLSHPVDCTEFAQKSFAFGLFSTFALWRRRNTTTAADIETIDDGGEGKGAGDWVRCRRSRSSPG